MQEDILKNLVLWHCVCDVIHPQSFFTRSERNDMKLAFFFKIDVVTKHQGGLKSLLNIFHGPKAIWHAATVSSSYLLRNYSISCCKIMILCDQNFCELSVNVIMRFTICVNCELHKWQFSLLFANFRDFEFRRNFSFKE